VQDALCMFMKIGYFRNTYRGGVGRKYGSLGFLNVRVDSQLQITILWDTILSGRMCVPG
jgi:hypothetical protein